MTSARTYLGSDYKTLTSWWLAHGCVVPHKSQVDTLGVLGCVDGEPACYVCAYRVVDCPVVFLEHFVANPDVSAHKIIASVGSMFNLLLRVLKDDGYQMVRISTWSSTLAKVCEKKVGFKKISGEFNNMSLML